MFGLRWKKEDTSGDIQLSDPGTSQPDVRPVRDEEIESAESQRGSERIPSFKTGRVTYATGYKRDCMIIDYNRTGLRIRFPNYEALPAKVIVTVSSFKLHALARVVWQDNTDAGVQLLVHLDKQTNKPIQS